MYTSVIKKDRFVRHNGKKDAGNVAWEPDRRREGRRLRGCLYVDDKRKFDKLKMKSRNTNRNTKINAGTAIQTTNTVTYPNTGAQLQETNTGSRIHE